MGCLCSKRWQAKLKRMGTEGESPAAAGSIPLENVSESLPIAIETEKEGVTVPIQDGYMEHVVSIKRLLRHFFFIRTKNI